MKNIKIRIAVIIFAIVVVLTLSSSYAYFAANSISKGNQLTVHLKTAQLGIIYDYGNTVVTPDENLHDDWDGYLPVTVESTGTIEQNFNIIWDTITTNTIVGSANIINQIACPPETNNCTDVKDDFTWTLYELTNEYENPTSVSGGTEVETGYLYGVESNDIILRNETIGALAKKYYVLHMHFNYNSERMQNYQQGKAFNGNIKVTIENSEDVQNTLANLIKASYTPDNGALKVINGDSYVQGDIEPAPQDLDEDSPSEMVVAMTNGNFGTEYTKETFVEHYFINNDFNEEQYNSDFLNVLLAEQQDAADYIVGEFGSLSNYIIAYATDNVDDSEGMPALLEGAILPTMESLFLSEEVIVDTLITNNYVELDNLLWQIYKINSDNSISLVLHGKKNDTNRIVYDAYNSSKYPFSSSVLASTLGIGNNSLTSPLLKLFNNTTLGDLLVKKDYNYSETPTSGTPETKTINSYVSILSLDDYKKSLKNENSDLELSYLYKNYLALADVTESNTMREIDYSSSNYYNNMSYSVAPVITIENIEVTGTGSISDPYLLEEEEKTSNLATAQSIFDYLVKVNNVRDAYINNKYSYLYNFSYNFYKQFGLDSAGDYSNVLYDSTTKALTVGLNINGKCYYNDYGSRTVYETETTGNCVAKTAPTLSLRINSESTYDFESELNVDTETFDMIATSNGEGTLSYQWQWRGIGEEFTNITDGNTAEATISGSSTNVLRVSPKDFNYKEFKCIVSQTFEDGTVLTDEIHDYMSITPKSVSIINQPENLTRNRGDNVNISIDAQSVTSYQWQQEIDGTWTNLNNGTGISGVNTDTLTINTNQSSPMTSNYRCLVSGYYDRNATTLTSNAATLTLQEFQITKHPESTTMYSGNSTSFSVEAGGATTYQWQQEIGSNWVNLTNIDGRVSGVTTNELTLTPIDEFARTTNYRCVVSNGITTLNSEAAVLTFLTSIDFIGTVSNSEATMKNYVGPANKLSIPENITVGDYTYSFDYDTCYDAMPYSSIESMASEKQTACNFLTSYNESTASDEDKALYNEIAPIVVFGYNAGTHTLVSESRGTLKTINGGKISRLYEMDFTNPDISNYMDYIRIPKTVVTIGKNAFASGDYEPLEDLVFEGAINNTSMLTTIGDEAFGSTSLTSVILPSSLVTVGSRIFYNARDDLKIYLRKEAIPAGFDSYWNNYFYNDEEKTATVYLLNSGGHYIEYMIAR